MYPQYSPLLCLPYCWTSDSLNAWFARCSWFSRGVWLSFCSLLIRSAQRTTLFWMLCPDSPLGAVSGAPTTTSSSCPWVWVHAEKERYRQLSWSPSQSACSAEPSMLQFLPSYLSYVAWPSEYPRFVLHNTVPSVGSAPRTVSSATPRAQLVRTADATNFGVPNHLSVSLYLGFLPPCDLRNDSRACSSHLSAPARVRAGPTGCRCVNRLPSSRCSCSRRSRSSVIPRYTTCRRCFSS